MTSDLKTQASITNEARDKLFNQLTRAVFDRIMAGSYDYNRDLSQLQQYRDKVSAYGSDVMEARIVNAMAILHSVCDQYERAEEAYNVAFDLNLKAGNLNGAVTILHNLGFLLHNLGRYGEALTAFERADELIDDSDEHVRVFCMLNSARIRTLSTLELYPETQVLFERVQAASERLFALDNVQFAEIMGSVYGNMARVRTHEGEYGQAFSFANRALELMQSVGTSNEIANTYFTLARIALESGEYDDEAVADYEAHVQRADSLLVGRQQNGPQEGRDYFNEATYAYEKGQADVARWLAQKALDILESHDRADDAAQVRDLLDQLS